MLWQQGASSVISNLVFRTSKGLREWKPSGCERSWPMPLASPKFPWLFLSHTRSFLPCSPSQFSHSLFTCILLSDTLTFFCLSQFFMLAHTRTQSHTCPAHTRARTRNPFLRKSVSSTHLPEIHLRCGRMVFWRPNFKGKFKKKREKSSCSRFSDIGSLGKDPAAPNKTNILSFWKKS